MTDVTADSNGECQVVHRDQTEVSAARGLRDLHYGLE